MTQPPHAMGKDFVEIMVPANALVITTEIRVQVRFNLSIDVQIDICYKQFNLITDFCNDDITCNGQGKCDNNGICQCIDSFYGDSCIGTLEYLAIQGNHLIFIFQLKYIKPF